MSNSKMEEEDRTLRLLLQRQSTWSRYGNRKVCCSGHLVVGPIRTWWWLLEIWTVIVAAVFVSEYNEYHYGVLIAGLILFVVCIGSCLAINFGDPGILPKPTFFEAYHNAKEVSLMMKNGVHNPFRSVTVGDQVMRYTYCMRCHHFRPPDSGHCYTCDSCIEHWDHHCPIFGGCVGKKNFVAFHIMCISQALIWAFWLTVSGFATANVVKERHVSAEQILLRCKTIICVLIGFLGAAILPVILSRTKCDKHMCEPKPKKSSQTSIESSLCKKLRVFPHDKLQNSIPSSRKGMSGDWSTTAIVPGQELKYISINHLIPPHVSSPRASTATTYFSGEQLTSTSDYSSSSDNSEIEVESEKRTPPPPPR